MIELKTLKDLYEPLEFIKSKGTLKVIRYRKLKQEAIKQIIVLQMLKLDYGLIRFIKQLKINSQIKWIKHFFNIK